MSEEMQAIDRICADFRDEYQLRVGCDRAHREGFTGKIAIHPNQVPIINICFAPTEGEVAHVRRVVNAFALPDGRGAAGLDGGMLNLPHLKQAAPYIAAGGGVLNVSRAVARLMLSVAAIAMALRRRMSHSDELLAGVAWQQARRTTYQKQCKDHGERRCQHYDDGRWLLQMKRNDER